jgi:SAM-dependent methyltransferase
MKDTAHLAGEPGSAAPARLRPEHELFLVSFIALFLEMMLIRWVPSVYRLVAYYANLMLISSFLGLGLGALASRQLNRLSGLFAPILFALIVFLLISRRVLLPANSLELRFWSSGSPLLGYLALVTIFFLNVFLFMPLGQRVGQLFNQLPPLRAYHWDICGSLAGTLSFLLFSYLHFSPVVGMAGVMALYFAITPMRARRLLFIFFSGTILFMVAFADRGVVWSPYYHIRIESREGGVPHFVTAPPPGLKRSLNPPIFMVQVNQDFYQAHGSLNLARYSPPSKDVMDFNAFYSLPYRLAKPPQDVLVAGSGGGVDVEAALLADARRIDAVEIDPVLVQIARKFNAADPYADPRVHVHIDDARGFLQKTAQRYDLITFGYLDSQALFSSMANVRLDGFVYTVESFRAAYRLLKDDGSLFVSFNAWGKNWLVYKLYLMLEEATGQAPLVYLKQGQTPVTFCVARRPLPAPPTTGAYRRFIVQPLKVPLATDDWPYLYLSRRGLPLDYLIVIGTLTLLSLGILRALHRERASAQSAFFLLLGIGFMLMETKSIVDASLYLGATWLVALLVVSGVLTMILLANQLAGRLPSFSEGLYIPLVLSLVLLIFFPPAWILSWPYAGRILWTVLVIPLPILFAGLIFSTSMREAPNPSANLGANLIGATLGGFLEYLGMAIGYRQLSMLVIVAYLASLLTLRRSKMHSYQSAE